jgi:hypothetical protein
MDKVERNNRIVALRRLGNSVQAIAAEEGLSAAGVRYILNAQEDEHSEFPIPIGISLRVARSVLTAIGVWPCPETAAEIALRRREIFRSGCLRTSDMKEVDAWLALSDDFVA